VLQENEQLREDLAAAYEDAEKAAFNAINAHFRGSFDWPPGVAETLGDIVANLAAAAIRARAQEVKGG